MANKPHNIIAPSAMDSPAPRNEKSILLWNVNNVRPMKITPRRAKERTIESTTGQPCVNTYICVGMCKVIKAETPPVSNSCTVKMEYTFRMNNRLVSLSHPKFSRTVASRRTSATGADGLGAESASTSSW
eukprot:CCRYP_013579-RC/>CCRYP_013579-RC protein AED:0.46 eAED:1.00 QI:0/0/0/1/0/0/2/0/129